MDKNICNNKDRCVHFVSDGETTQDPITGNSFIVLEDCCFYERNKLTQVSVLKECPLHVMNTAIAVNKQVTLNKTVVVTLTNTGKEIISIPPIDVTDIIRRALEEAKSLKDSVGVIYPSEVDRLVDMLKDVLGY